MPISAVPKDAKRLRQIPGAGAMGGCELSDVGARKRPSSGVTSALTSYSLHLIFISKESIMMSL